jgi:fructan beta-fructosidase
MAIDEPYRPAFHFTPPRMWMNDPNGLVHYNGLYHMFYQYHPESTVWGPMHWGHATSPDLVSWQHQPVALYPDEQGMIFSGSAVIDWHNTAGFGAEAMVALFTHHLDHRQSQSLAYSLDQGSTWIKYPANPVIPTPDSRRDFRDPKVFWYAEHGAGHWVMVLVGGNGVLFYTSPNLIEWAPSSSFGFVEGTEVSIWETPDLFRLPIDGGPAERWVLSIGVLTEGSAGGTATRYFVGDFDGRTFSAETPSDTVLWADYGADFYAAQSWSDEPRGRRIWIAWMSNWQYARVTPTASWRGAFSVPRELSLTQTAEGLRLRQQPIAELERLRGAVLRWGEQTIEPGAGLAVGQGAVAELIAEFEVGATSGRFGLRVLAGAGEHTEVGYDVPARQLYIDRTKSGAIDFEPGFAGRHAGPLAPDDGLVRLRILVDRSSVEVFGNGGVVAITDQVFPQAGSVGIELFAEGAPARLRSLELYPLSVAAG